jgi:PHD/YefM family antitoxin component YafN of YafNO toxin-antitoxin module
MPLSEQEKEQLAERVVAILRDPAPRRRAAELKARVEAGDEGEDGLNSAVLAIVVVVGEKLRL